MFRSKSASNASTLSMMQSLTSLLQRVQFFDSVDVDAIEASSLDLRIKAHFNSLNESPKSTASKLIPYSMKTSRSSNHYAEGSLESNYGNSLEDSSYQDRSNLSSDFDSTDDSLTQFTDTTYDDEDIEGPLDEREGSSDVNKSLAEISLCEVAQHDMYHDCWIIFYDKVYDVTNFLYEHPGGEELLMEHAGRDGTMAFRSVGHTKAALTNLKEYIIGILPPHERIFNDWETN